MIIFGHAPPGVFEGAWRGAGTHWLQRTQNLRYPHPTSARANPEAGVYGRYSRLVEEYSDVIVGQFFGHQNTDTFRVFYNSKREWS